MEQCHLQAASGLEAKILELEQKIPSSTRELKVMEKNEVREYTFIKKEQKGVEDGECVGAPAYNLSGLKNYLMTPDLLARLDQLIKSNFCDPMN
jgi:hypothetical protein